MRRAELKHRLTEGFQTILGGLEGGDDFLPGLKQGIRELESDETSSNVVEVLLSFGRLLKTVHVLRTLDEDTIHMDREVQAVSQELGRIVLQRKQAVRPIVEAEAQRMAQIMREWLEAEPSEEPVPDDWIPSTGIHEFDQDLYGLDAGQHLRMAVERLGLAADVSPWADIPAEYETRIRFIIGAGMERLVEEYCHGGPLFMPGEMYPKRFWWHRLVWEAYQPYLEYDFRRAGDVSGHAFFIPLFMGILVIEFGLILGPLIIALGLALFAASLPLTVHAVLRKRVIIDRSGVEYWAGKKKRFEARWTDVVKVSSGRSRQRITGDVLEIESDGQSLRLGTVFHFPASELQEIFQTIIDILKAHPHVLVEDNLGWA